MLADVNWKSYTGRNLFFLNMTDRYNYIKILASPPQKGEKLHDIGLATRAKIDIKLKRFCTARGIQPTE